jgi:hypothetical protein
VALALVHNVTGKVINRKRIFKDDFDRNSVSYKTLTMLADNSADNSLTNRTQCDFLNPNYDSPVKMLKRLLWRIT